MNGAESGEPGAGGDRAGLLRIVATPLGNLGDLSPRALDALASADAIAAEDTRRTGNLLKKLGLPRRPLLSYYAPREREKARAIVRRLRAGETVALVTDGGTPGVSDPGAVLVAEAVAAGVRVEPVPGPSAVTLALSVSSFGASRFVFEGFLPARKSARRKRLEELSGETRPLVLYEAPHRLAAALEDLAAVLGPGRRATVVREATKVFEEIREGTLAELAERFGEGAKGEVVLVVEGGRPDPGRVTLAAEQLMEIATAGGLSPAQAARTLAQVTGLPRGRWMRVAKGRET